MSGGRLPVLKWCSEGIRPLLILGVVGLVGWALTISSAYQMRLFTIVGIYALLALGYQFIFGHAGALALTQGSFFGVGAYATGILGSRYGLGAETTLLLSIILPVLLAALVAAPVLRLDSHYFALATLGIGQVLLLIAIGWQDLTGGSNGLSGIPGLTLLGYEIKKGAGIMVAVWCCVAIGALISWRITRGLYGAALQVSRENPIAAQAIGIDTARLRYATFLLSAMFAGLAGALYAHTIRVVSVEVLEFPIMVACLTITVLGGRTHIAGAILGALLIVNLPEWFRVMEKYYLIAYGVALLVAIIVCALRTDRPAGADRGSRPLCPNSSRPPRPALAQSRPGQPAQPAACGLLAGNGNPRRLSGYRRFLSPQMERSSWIWLPKPLSII